MLEASLEEDSVIKTLSVLERNPLFWFLEKDGIDQIQHGSLSKTLILQENGRQKTISVFAETLAANPDKKLNEDSYLVLPFGAGRMLFAVMDGASSQREIEALAAYGVTGAFYISHLVSLGFKDSPQSQELSQRENLTAGEIMKTVNSWIFEKMQKVPGVNYSDVLSVPGMATTLILIDLTNSQATIAHVADTVACAFYRDGRIKILTPNQNERFDRETMEFIGSLCDEYGCSLAQIHEIPEAKAKIKAQLQESFRRKINKENACGILNGMPELVRNNLIFESKIKISRNLSSIFLVSDGARIPYTGVGISGEGAAQSLIQNFQSSEGASVLEAGALRLDNDPDFEKIHRLKHRDDATIIEISLNKQ
ncbi:MAG: protein phosphatase 2C domain-containing protein [Patescibacteria group bacterium]